jgi:hypothetical protein
MSLLVLVVDDEPDVEVLFRQQFRHDLREGRFTMNLLNRGTWRVHDSFRLGQQLQTCNPGHARREARARERHRHLGCG